MRFGVRNFLQTHGFEVKEADSQRAAEKEFRQSPPDLALLDYCLPDGDGLSREFMESELFGHERGELRNVIERALLHARGAPVLDHADLRFGGESSEASSPSRYDDDLSLTLEELERKHVERVLRAANNSVEAAAVRLGISRSALYQRLKRYRDQLGVHEMPS